MGNLNLLRGTGWRKGEILTYLLSARNCSTEYPCYILKNKFVFGEGVGGSPSFS